MRIAHSFLTFLWLITLAGFVPSSLMAQEEKAAEEKKPAAEEKKAESAKEKPDVKKVAEEKKPAAEEKKPAAEEKKPAAEEKKPAAEEKKPAAEEKKPAAEEKKPAAAERKPAKESSVELKEVVINLDNPSGLVVHPKTGEIFIASNDGIHRFIPSEMPLKCPLEVTDFPTDIYGKGPKYDISALGVAFLDDEHLVVGDGSLPDGQELVRVYKIPEEPTGKPQKADEAAYTVGPITAGDQSARGEGNYYGVAVLDGTVYVTNNGDDTKGWISKFTVKDGKPSKLTPFIATKVATQVDAPVPIAVSDDNMLVVGQMGEVTVPGDSLLTMYDPKTFNPDDPKTAKSWKTGLSDIAGLAYSPKTKKWYCTDFAWAKPKEGGLFELTIDGDKATAKKLASLDKPTALTFDKDGNLYVAVFGTAKEGDAMTPGKLLMIDAAQLSDQSSD